MGVRKSGEVGYSFYMIFKKIKNLEIIREKQTRSKEKFQYKHEFGN